MAHTGGFYKQTKKNKNMKQLLSLFLFLLPCLAWAQYPTNGNQKITLGEQTTADGLIWRGVANDTNVITPFSDTSAYIILDTVNSKFYHYNRTSTYWSVAGGGTAVTTFSGGTTGLTPSTATSGAVTLGGTLAVANGGTGADMSSLPNNYLVRKNSSGVFDTTAIYEAGGNVGVGTTTPAYKLEVSGANAQSLQVTSTNGDLANLHLKSTGNNVWSLSADAVLRFKKDATESMRIDQSNNVGIGTISVTEKLHVVGNGLFTGNVGIGSATPTASGTGITFPATQSASTNANTLDDYEEGTWTPTIRGSTVSGTYTPSTTTAYYTKVGNVVTVWCFVDMRSGTATGGTGVLLLESLPFNYKAGSAFAGNTRFDSVDYPQTSSHGTFAGRTSSGSAASILFQISLDNAGTDDILITGFTTSSLLTTNFSYTTN
jgi:hypothetical protein